MREEFDLRIRIILPALAAVTSVMSAGFAQQHAPPSVQPTGAGASPYSIRWETNTANPRSVQVAISGFSSEQLRQLRQRTWDQAQWQSIWSTYASQGDALADLNVPPIAGAYQIDDRTVRFSPLFQFEPGVNYSSIFRVDRLPWKTEGQTKVSSTFKLPAAALNPTTVVSEVFPTAPVLPENLLKFYVHFSAPMSRGRIYELIHLKTAEGAEVELPFLELDEELWDQRMQRLTLFIDPGRIKRGVKPLEEIGPSLEEGKSYQLVIDRAWKDANGNPLKSEFSKSFKVGPPDRDPPEPRRWKIGTPLSGSTHPWTIDFGEPMDHALAQRLIALIGPDARPVAGTPRLTEGERKWVFTPEQPWRQGAYEIRVQTIIEDLAGNNIGKPFEVDLFEGVQKRIENKTVILPAKLN